MAKIIKRYRLNFYSHAGEVIRTVESNDFDMLQSVFDTHEQYYPNAAFFVKDSTGKWKENFDLIKGCQAKVN